MSNTATNGVAATEQHAIEIDSSPEESSEVVLIVSSALVQLDEHSDLMALGQGQGSPTTQDPLTRAVSQASPFVEQDSPLFVPQGSYSPSDAEVAEALRPDLIERNGFMVMVPRLQNQWEYLRYEEPVTAVEILEQYDDGEYLVQLDDESEEVVSRYSVAPYCLPLWCVIWQSFLHFSLHLTNNVPWSSSYIIDMLLGSSIMILTISYQSFNQFRYLSVAHLPDVCLCTTGAALQATS